MLHNLKTLAVLSEINYKPEERKQTEIQSWFQFLATKALTEQLL